MIMEVEKELIPYRFDIELAGELFTFEFHYNQRFDFFTVSLYQNDTPLVLGEKLMLNRPLFKGLADIRLPKVTITPKDRSGQERRITYDNLGETVFLFVE